MSHSRCVILLTSLAIALWACDGSDTRPLDPGNGGRVDAGGAAADAGPAADGGTADAGTADAGIAGGPAKITIYGDGRPQPFIDVLFQDREGTFVAYEQTTFDGTLVHDVQPDSMITVLARAGQRFFGFTFAGIQPGDDIVLGEREVPDSTPVATASITFSQLPPRTVDLVVNLGCVTDIVVLPPTSSTAPARAFTTIDVPPDCLTAAGTFHAFVLARDANTQVIAYATATDVAPAAAGPTVVGVAGWSADARQIDLTASNARPRAYYLNVKTAFIRDLVSFEAGEGGRLLMNGTATVPLFVPPAFAQGLGLEVTAAYGQAGRQPEAVSALTRRMPSTIPSAIAVDLTQDLLPPIYDVVIDQSSVSRPVVRWRVEGEPAGADGHYLILRFDQSGEQHDWNVVLPPDYGGSFRFPEVPARFMDHLPTGQASFVDRRVMLIDASWLAGYDQLRQDVGPTLSGGGAPAGDVTYRISLGGVLMF